MDRVLELMKVGSAYYDSLRPRRQDQIVPDISHSDSVSRLQYEKVVALVRVCVVKVENDLSRVVTQLICV